MFKAIPTFAISSFSILLSTAGFKLMNDAKNELSEFNQQLEQAGTDATDLPFVSVLIPARNEQDFIGECLVSILEQEYSPFEVICIDDNSSDRTPQILAELKKRYPERLRVVSCLPPQDDWLGKNNALWQGYLQVSSDAKWLLFMDADTKLYPGTLRKTVKFAQQQQFALISLVPKVKLNGFWENIIAPEILKFYTFAANNPLHPVRPDSVEAASAVGPFILVERQAYQEVDGHRGVRNELVEDVELARRFRSRGFTTIQKAAFDYLEMTPYQDLGDLWESVGKNLFVVARKSWGTVGFVIGVEALYGLVPIGLLLLNSKTLLGKLKRGKVEKSYLLSWLVNLVSVTTVLATQVRAHRIGRLSGKYGLFYPIAAVLSSVLMLDSAFRTGVARQASWKGRTIKLNN